MMSPRKTPLALVTVGLLISNALLGQEAATGQVKPEDFAKVGEALASQREALALSQKRRDIQQQEIRELKSLLRKQKERQTESADATCIMLASANGTVPTAVVRQPALTSGNVNVIGAIFPDVVVRRNPSISPMPAAPWVSGLHRLVAPNVSIAAYYRGSWAQRASFGRMDGACVGCGLVGSSDLDTRQLPEATLVATWRIVKTENRRSAQFAPKFSWLGVRRPARMGAQRLASARPYVVF